MFAATRPWGFILFARNVEDPEQLRRLTTELREAVGRDAPIFIDQEGGRVARMRPPHWRSWPPAQEQVALSRRRASEVMYLRYRIIAHELRAVGIDGNCAPLLDLIHAETHPVLANRCYGEDVVKVSKIAGVVASGLVDGGVLPVIKHMPGQGRAATDSHKELPVVTAREKVLNASDFLAFQSVANLPIGMTAHVVFRDIDPDHPATTSRKMIGVIRDRIGFGGLLMSDDIGMKALSGRLEDRCRDALQAGCDLILFGNGTNEQMEVVAAATGGLAGQAGARAEAALGWRKTPTDIDIAALDAEFEGLTTHQAG